MSILILGLILFFGIHSIAIVAMPLRLKLIGTMGEMGWRGLYSAIAFVGFYCIVTGYAAARLDPTVLYTPPIFTRHLTLLLMLPVFPMLLAAYLPGRIQRTLKHPMLVATKLWALSHLLANGMLADVALFGAFLTWAVIDRISLKRRPAKKTLGAPAKPWNDILAVVLGLGLYVVFVFWAHEALIGFPPVSM